MNQIKSIQGLSLKELECGILSFSASWHHEYRDQAYIFVGGLNKELTEGDVLTIFSQYGVPVNIKLARDSETGESKGFGYLKYEDQRSTVLAVDNLNGITIGGRMLRVDHTFYTPRNWDQVYTDAVNAELRKDMVDEGQKVSSNQKSTPALKAEPETNLDSSADDELKDPMASYI
ncbi:LAME_0F08636g1_1 [Lachancea meyersii CBS 8951]|uniref:LAME_0F08636g1_1 n=1 Tax=Lachancea meyersii CBS 8951 TaxID=1266667 RepID=A0A1G4JUY1_9SACH|nr:LAME_0F08636g1_1 [Lachancea meyersii CBS 8951]